MKEKRYCSTCSGKQRKMQIAENVVKIVAQIPQTKAMTSLSRETLLNSISKKKQHKVSLSAKAEY